MSKERELLKKAIQIIETLGPDEEAYEFMNEILLLEPEQEPVAWKDKTYGNLHQVDYGNSIPLYLAPPKREPLSDEKIADLWSDTNSVRNFARAIEREHGIGDK